MNQSVTNMTFANCQHPDWQSIDPTKNDDMAHRPKIRWAQLVLLCLAVLIAGNGIFAFADESHRRTPLVQAIENCQHSVVNLRGQKTLTEQETEKRGDQVRHVNGMGTGVVIDPRGYILTNYHVVENVLQIQVTTGEHETTSATLIARDPNTDLAIIKVDSVAGLETIKLGTSSDLLLAETVAAVGNAYGYEHTVTTGIISHLKRTVQINDDQIYEDLIQVDAAINPGNSGGPLLNLDGEMIGINVAVRVGAQGIAFAIPVNEAIEVAAKLLNEVSETKVSPGIKVATRYVDHQPLLFVTEVEPGSNAANSGLRTGDEILSINGISSKRSLDFQTVLLEAHPEQDVTLFVQRDSGTEEVVFKLEPPTKKPLERTAWDSLGMQFSLASEAEMQGKHPNYQRGLRITAVRNGSPAEKEGIKVGDVLVAMHGWKTESFENFAYILDQPEIKQNRHFMFYILRDREPFFGQMRLAELR